jgi:hypothetical protein
MDPGSDSSECAGANRAEGRHSLAQHEFRPHDLRFAAFDAAARIEQLVPAFYLAVVNA